MTNLSKPLVVTSGEPAGIGPELCLALAASPWAKQIVVVADPEMLAERAHMLDLKVTLCNYEAGSSRNGSLQVLPQPLENPAVCGTLDPGNARSLLDGIERAVSGCQSGEFSGLVTAPLQKSAINDAGIDFTGHTEFLANRLYVHRLQDGSERRGTRRDFKILDLDQQIHNVFGNTPTQPGAVGIKGHVFERQHRNCQWGIRLIDVSDRRRPRAPVPIPPALAQQNCRRDPNLNATAPMEFEVRMR